MVNRSKNIGTMGESAVVKALLPYFPLAERLTLSGAYDQGDIGHCGDFIFEVKSGHQTDQFGDKQLAKWTAETATEAKNRGVPYGILVVKRSGYGVARADKWWAYLDVEHLAGLTGGHYITDRRLGVISARLELGQLLEILADMGHTPAAP